MVVVGQKPSTLVNEVCEVLPEQEPALQLLELVSQLLESAKKLKIKATQ